MENEQRACRKPRWYDCSFRSPIDPSTLRRLMRRSNLQGALQAFGAISACSPLPASSRPGS